MKDTKEIKDMLQTLSDKELISLIARQLSRPSFAFKKEDILWAQWITEHDKPARLCKKQRQIESRERVENTCILTTAVML